MKKLPTLLLVLLIVCCLVSRGNTFGNDTAIDKSAKNSADNENPAKDNTPQTPLPKLKPLSITSSLDGSAQPSLIWIPEDESSGERPLLVLLHSWSADYKQPANDWHRLAAERNWIILRPNFRGPNSRPEACGSRLARQDILDAIDHVLEHHQVAKDQIYLAGVSGGGHMTMLMASYYPERFSAASAWVGISDLADWYRFHLKDGMPQGYAKMVLQSCGGAPGESDEIDDAYCERSPIHHLQSMGDFPLDINAGVHDGHKGSVPVAHSLRAFNVIAKTLGTEQVTEDEMTQLWENLKLTDPRPGDEKFDEIFGRDIYLQRQAGQSRVTIFEGGHEGIAAAAVAWLAGHRRPTTTKL